eukprot:COSAG01_NODE_3908_length_5556_cov_3.550852_3_plen_95_part_00
MKSLGVSMDIYGLTALRFAHGTRHRHLDQAIQENGLRIAKSLRLSAKKVAVYRAVAAAPIVAGAAVESQRVDGAGPPCCRRTYINSIFLPPVQV